MAWFHIRQGDRSTSAAAADISPRCLSASDGMQPASRSRPKPPSTQNRNSASTCSREPSSNTGRRQARGSFRWSPRSTSSSTFRIRRPSSPPRRRASSRADGSSSTPPTALRRISPARELPGKDSIHFTSTFSVSIIWREFSHDTGWASIGVFPTAITVHPSACGIERSTG